MVSRNIPSPLFIPSLPSVLKLGNSFSVLHLFFYSSLLIFFLPSCLSLYSLLISSSLSLLLPSFFSFFGWHFSPPPHTFLFFTDFSEKLWLFTLIMDYLRATVAWGWCVQGALFLMLLLFSQDSSLFEQAYVKISSEDSATYSYQGSELSLRERRQEEKKGALPIWFQFFFPEVLPHCLLLLLGVFDGEEIQRLRTHPPFSSVPVLSTAPGEHHSYSLTGTCIRIISESC